jgi:hypothetical protein
LHFAGSLVGLSLGFQLLIAKNLDRIKGSAEQAKGAGERNRREFVHCRILVIIFLVFMATTPSRFRSRSRTGQFYTDYKSTKRAFS